MASRTAATLLCLALAATSVAAQNFYEGLPAPLQRIAFEQMLGEQVDLSLGFRDETGQRVTLGELTSGRPVILALVYYDCPMLCSLTMNGVALPEYAAALGADAADAVFMTMDSEGRVDSLFFSPGSSGAFRHFTSLLSSYLQVSIPDSADGPSWVSRESDAQGVVRVRYAVEDAPTPKGPPPTEYGIG